MDNHIALIIDDISDGYQSPIVQGVNDVCRELKLGLRIYCTSMYFPVNTGNCQYGGLIFDLVQESQCFGVIVPAQIYRAIQNQVDVLSMLQRSGKHMVSLGRYNEQIPSISIDDRTAIALAIQHLAVDHGLHRIAFISGPDYNHDAQQRLAGYQEQVSACDLISREDYIYRGQFHFQDGIDAVNHFYQCQPRPEAIVASDDYMALGAIEQAKALNWSVRITGFDNIEAASLSDPSLTTVDQDLYEIGGQAVWKLHRRVRALADDWHSQLAAKLVIRNSCGCRDLQSTAAAHCDAKEINFANGELQRSALSVVNMLSVDRHEIPQALYLIEKLLVELRNQLNDQLNVQPILNSFRELVHLHDDLTWVESNRRSLHAVLELFLTRPLTNDQTLYLRKLRFYCAREVNRHLLAHQQMRYDRLQQHKRDIDEFCQAINTCFSLKDIINVLKSHSVMFELGDFVVGLFKSNKQLTPYPSEVPKWSTVIFDRLANRPDQNYSIATIDIMRKQHSERLLILPLNHRGLEFGYLAVSYHPNLLQLYTAVAFHLGFALKNILTIQHSQQDERKLKATLAQLRGANAELEQNSVTDELTGLLNRRGFFRSAKQHMQFSKQNHDPFVMGYADLDNLKQINDELGHDRGDLAIWLAGQVLKQCFRRSDIVARIAGDEFAFILIDTQSDHIHSAQSKISHFCLQANQQSFPFDISLSVGFTAFDPAAPESLSELMNRADARLYETKVWKKENQLRLTLPNHFRRLKE